jgi:flagellar protein FlbD
MISLTRFHNGERIAVNVDLIERVEETPDTVVTLTNGNRYIVQQSLDEIVELVRTYWGAVLAIGATIARDTSPSTQTRLHLLKGIISEEEAEEQRHHRNSPGDRS